MSTYNGDKWIDTLLDSLIRQTYGNWVLWVRDDGSSDGTVGELVKFSIRDPRIRILSKGGEHLGAQKSFFWLLANAPDAAAYVMFCDQDDLWHSDKIAATIEAMISSEAKENPMIPILVHTDMRLVDENLKLLCSSTKKHLGFKVLEGNLFARLMVQNVVTGCTMMINRSLVQASQPLPQAALMHDWWIALVSAALGKVVYLDRSTIDYRQHGGNASGSIRRTPFIRGLQRFANNRAQFSRAMIERFGQCMALEAHLSRFPVNSSYRLLLDFLSAAKSGRWRVLLSALRNGVAMQGLCRNGIYYFLLAKSRWLQSAQPDPIGMRALDRGKADTGLLARGTEA
ncbi:MAG: glycosyltransferase family 2 protein [Elusimicrobiota bacterium]